MKKQVVILGIAVLLLIVGLSGCIEINRYENDKESEGGDYSDNGSWDGNDNWDGSDDDSWDGWGPETIIVSGNYIERTVHYFDKPVKLFYSGNYNDVTVTKETNLIKVFLSGNYNILRVSKSHSFEQFVSGNGCKIVYYD